jgi:hypothetical protein
LDKLHARHTKLIPTDYNLTNIVSYDADVCFRAMIIEVSVVIILITQTYFHKPNTADQGLPVRADTLPLPSRKAKEMLLVIDWACQYGPGCVYTETN